jgi:hypothetical protein
MTDTTAAGVRVIERSACNDPCKPSGWQIRDTDGTDRGQACQ